MERQDGSRSVMRRRRRGLVVSLALALAASMSFVTIVATTAPAHAHCPSGTDGYYYAYAGNDNVEVRSVSTVIGWIGSPNVCNSRSWYSVTIGRGIGGSDPGWLQVGWIFRDGYSRPMGYCERMPRSGGTGSYALTEYSVTEQAQRYTYYKNSDQQFACRIDGETLRLTIQSWIGFTQGAAWIPVQAEAHAQHVQLGRIAPDWLNFDESQKVNAGDGPNDWRQLNLNVGPFSDDPVWNVGQPNIDGFRVNTDASH